MVAVNFASKSASVGWGMAKCQLSIGLENVPPTRMGFSLGPAGLIIYQTSPAKNRVSSSEFTVDDLIDLFSLMWCNVNIE